MIGNELIDNADEIIKNEIINYNFDLNLVDLGCYIMPNIYKDNEILVNNLELYKKYETLVFTYSFGDNKETLDISFWSKWMTPQYSEANPEMLIVENPFVLNKDSVDDYVLSLAKKYNTYGDTRTFVTSTGEVKQITKGDYGWILNKKKMDVNNKIYHYWNCFQDFFRFYTLPVKVHIAYVPLHSFLCMKLQPN